MQIIEEKTWDIVIKVWWALAWRSLLAIVAGCLGGFVIGFVIGFFGGLLHVPREMTQPFITVFSVGWGLFVSMLPIREIINRRFGKLRLCIVKIDD